MSDGSKATSAPINTVSNINPRKPLLQPGALWDLVLERTTHALEVGALLSLPTESNFVEQDGVRFLVRILKNLERKDADRTSRQAAGQSFNPFLPYDKDLYVIDFSETHVCVLNKFNVVDHHLLIITRAFEEQEMLLTLADFEALWIGLREIDGLAFYNGGKLAGASQPHKHLQLVPLPLSDIARLPIDPLLPTTSPPGSVIQIPNLPFAHAFVRLQSASPTETLDSYGALLRTLDLEDGSAGARQTRAYNLLVTREWMLLVRRSQEEFESISINSLGFAGALLVRNEQQMQRLIEVGPLTVLSRVAEI